MIHGETRGRKTEHHDWEKAAHEGAGSGIAFEEAIEIASHAVVLAEQLPGNIIKDVVQPGDDQHAVEHTVDEQANRAGAHD